MIVSALQEVPMGHHPPDGWWIRPGRGGQVLHPLLRPFSNFLYIFLAV
jgi:hypothetical protein